MVQFGIIVTLLFSLIIALFALANNQPVLINYFFGQAEISAILIILGSAVLGALIIGILSLIRNVKMSLRVREYSRKIEILNARIKELEKDEEINRLVAAKEKPPCGGKKKRRANELEKQEGDSC